MSAIRFAITVNIEGIGRRQHVVLAETESDAVDRLMRTYPTRQFGVVKILKGTAYVPSEPDRSETGDGHPDFPGRSAPEQHGGRGDRSVLGASSRTGRLCQARPSIQLSLAHRGWRRRIGEHFPCSGEVSTSARWRATCLDSPWSGYLGRMSVWAKRGSGATGWIELTAHGRIAACYPSTI